MKRVDSKPIWDAYVGAHMSTDCPNCGAQPNTWCSRNDGRVRRTPCIARIREIKEEVEANQ